MEHKWLNGEEIKQQVVSEFSSVRITKESMIDLQYVERRGEEILREYTAVMHTDIGETFQVFIGSDVSTGVNYWEFWCTHPSLSPHSMALMFAALYTHFELEDDRGDHVCAFLEDMRDTYLTQVTDPLVSQIQKRMLETEGAEFVTNLRNEVEVIKTLLTIIGVPLRADGQSNIWYKTIDDSSAEFDAVITKSQNEIFLGTTCTEFQDNLTVLGTRFEELQARVSIELVCGNHDFGVIKTFRQTFNKFLDLVKTMKAAFK